MQYHDQQRQKNKSESQKYYNFLLKSGKSF